MGDHPISPNAGRPDLIADGYHGTSTNYRYGCRCSECRTAQVAAIMRRRHARRGLPDGDPRHGTYTGYHEWRCSCDACRAANAAYQAEYRKTS